MLRVYKTIIRPHLEYCTQLWSPVAGHGNWSSIIELENVQRRFTRLINDIGTLSYSQRLENLNLTTLAERRIRGDLIEASRCWQASAARQNSTPTPTRADCREKF